MDLVGSGKVGRCENLLKSFAGTGEVLFEVMARGGVVLPVQLFRRN